MSTRYVGTCAVCGRRIKVRKGLLVHHGYERPGDGFIRGDCFAVNRTPHETSSETAKAFREFLELRVEEREASKARVEQADEVTYYYTIYVGLQKTPASVHVKRGDAERREGHQRIPGFNEVQRNIISELVAEIRSCQAGISRMVELERTWVELPLTTQEEETIRVTEATRAVKDQKKAERDAKKAVKSQRKADREARLQEKIDVAKRRAQALLDAVDPTDVQAVRSAYLKVLEIKLPSDVQYTFYDDHLGRTELLTSAGLVRSHNGKLMSSSYEVYQLARPKPR